MQNQSLQLWALPYSRHDIYASTAAVLTLIGGCANKIFVDCSTCSLRYAVFALVLRTSTPALGTRERNESFSLFFVSRCAWREAVRYLVVGFVGRMGSRSVRWAGLSLSCALHGHADKCCPRLPTLPILPITTHSTHQLRKKALVISRATMVRGWCYACRSRPSAQRHSPRWRLSPRHRTR